MRPSLLISLSVAGTLLVCLLGVGTFLYLNGKSTQNMSDQSINASVEIQNSDVVPVTPESSEITYNAYDVSQHSTEKDCWLIVEGKVYNVTDLISFHPGSAEPIINNCGKDATETFNRGGKSGTGHSPSAQSALTRYFVGVFNTTTPTSTQSQNIESEETLTKLMPSTHTASTTPRKVADNQCLASGQQDFACYESFYTDVVKNQGITVAFADLKERYAVSTLVQSYCHQLTHVIGRTGVRLGAGVGDAFTKGDTMCWSGFYHGVMEGFMGDIPLEALPKKLDSICIDIPGKDVYSFLYYNCVHGTGHGIMELYDDDLFSSLAVCEGYTGDWERESCSGGVFMENIMLESRGAISKYLKTDDPLYPCNAVTDIFKNSCYLMQTSHMLTAAGSDFSKVFETCETVEAGYRATCFQSLGRDASGRSTSNAVQTKASCMLGTTPFARENCIVGAVKDFISFYHSDVEAKQFCMSLESTLIDTCLSTTELYYKSF